MKKKKSNPYKYILLLVSILFCGLVYAITITDISNYPDGMTTSNSSILFNYNVSFAENDNMTELKWHWDGTNYTIFDSSLVLFYNFDNRSSLNENDLRVQDLSLYNNSGTVVGGSNITWTPNGKYGGAFNFSGGVASINVTKLTTNLNDSFSILLWLNPRQWNDLDVLSIKSTGGYEPIRINLQTVGSMQVVLVNDSNTRFYSSDASTISKNVYSFYAITFNQGIVNYYINGTLSETQDFGVNLKYIFQNQSNIQIGSRSGTSQYFNGSIDNVIIFNRSLSISEISQLYNSQLTKYDSQNYTIIINQILNYSTSRLNASSLIYNNIYFLCSSNSSSSQNCTSQKTITQTIPNKVLTANFITSIGNVGNIYGVGNYRAFFSDEGEYMPSIGSNTNSTWNRETFLNSGMNTERQMVYMQNIYSNDTSAFDLKVYNTSELKKTADLVKWGYNNGITIVISIMGMPTYLQNRTSGYCNESGLGTYGGGWTSCPPNNLSATNDMEVHLLNNITNYGQYKNVILEVGNEPFHQLAGSSGAWCNNRSFDHIDKATEYVKWYNSTYDAIKGNSNLSWIKIMGPAGSIPSDSPNLFKTFLSNMSTKMDGVSFHSDPDTDNVLLLENDITDILANCTFYGANCTYLLLSEWGTGTIYKRNSTSRFNELSNNYAENYIFMLNNYPANIIGAIWVWSERTAYSGGTQYWDMIVQPELVNPTYSQYKASYNVTKSFAHLCPAGSTVYTSSSDDSTIKTVTCKKGLQRSVIVINTDTTSKNVSLNFSGSGISQLTNYLDSSETYNNGDSKIMDSYDILYLTEDLQYPTITIQSPTATTYTSTTIDFNITLDEEGDTCIYSLNNFLTNYTMTKQGYVNEFKSTGTHAGLQEGSNTLIFRCNDTSGNINDTTSITFTVDACIPIQTLDSDGVTCIYANDQVCSPFARAGYRIIQIAGALIILAGSIYFLYTKGYLEEMTAGQLIMTFICIIIGIALFIASANIIAENCII